jgi:putative Mg2+ transporter-C (MgtC) family protein
MIIEVFEIYKETLYKFILAIVFGGIIGTERTFAHKQVGLRTFSLVSLGACLFSMLASNFPLDSNSRILANIIVGIGFLGGGIIFLHHDKLVGATTAAALWVTAAIGALIGQGYYFESFSVIILVLLILIILQYVENKMKNES